ncbi:hypothetical protein C2G38_2124540 [Gigaspora rosea]|uniref:Uncharacterized protein n=1 Tax=Gigaspora rosea TaxID=44941 RepID=A0A397TXU4_9GLOM|nr:hypothetical protein C2G38_2124540 [Gigaspora rosea]
MFRIINSEKGMIMVQYIFALLTSELHNELLIVPIALIFSSNFNDVRSMILLYCIKRLL